MLMYGLYNAEMLEKLIKTVHNMHLSQTLQEKLFAGQITTAFQWYIISHSNRDV